MALVKKLQAGGTAQLSLEDAINAKLASYNLKSKDERIIRTALGQLNSLKEGDFSVDDITKTFTVKNSTGNFQGSPDEIKSNWFTGKLRIDDDNDAMSVAASILHDAKKLITPKVPVEVSKIQIKATSPEEYINNIYKGEDGRINTFGPMTDDARKQAIYQNVGIWGQNYLDEGVKNTATADYIDANKIQAMKNAIASNDWDAFRQSALQLQWDPNLLLKTEAEHKFDADKITADAAKVEEDAKKAALATRLDAFTKYGVNPNLASVLAEKGWDPMQASEDPIQKLLAEYVKEQGLYAFQNPNQKYLFLDKAGEPVSISGENINLDSPLRGNQWLYDGVSGYASHSAFNEPQPDYASSFPELEKLNTMPNSAEVDNAKTIILKSLKNESVEKGNISNNAANILLTKLYDENIEDSEYEVISNLLRSYRDNVTVPGSNTSKTTNKSEKSPLDHFIESITAIKWKHGGVLKYASGDAFKEFKKKENASKKVAKEPAKDISGTWKDMGNTEKALRAASIAGVGASFIPGVGVAGAIATTLADIGADAAKDGWDFNNDVMNTNTLFNVGFIGLSAIGLGGLRTLGKSLKLVKGAGAVGKEVKAGLTIAEQAARAKNSTKIFKAAGLTVEEGEALQRLSKMARTAGNGEIKTVEEFMKRIATATPTQKAFAEKGINALGKVAKVADPVLGSTRVGKLLQASTKTTIAGAKATGSGMRTAAKWGFKAGMVAPLLKLPGTAYTGITEGWEYTKPTDVKDIVMGGFAAKNLIGSIRQPMITRRNAEDLVKRNEYIKSEVKKAGTKLKTELDAPKILRLAENNPIHPEYAQMENAVNIRNIARGKGRVDLKNIEPSKPYNFASTDKGGTEALFAAQSPTKFSTSATSKETLKKELEEAGKLATEVKQRAKPSFKGEYKIPRSKSLTLYAKISPQTVKRELANKAMELKRTEQTIKANAQQSTALVHVPSAKQKFSDYLKTHSTTIEPEVTIIPKKKVVATNKKVTPKTIKLHPITNKDKEVVYHMPSKEARIAKEKSAYLNKTKKSSKKSDFKEVLWTKVSKNQLGGILKFQNGSTGINTVKGVWPQAKEWFKDSVNPTGIANLAMFASTVGANRRIGNLQRKAVADSLVSLPTMSQTHIRVDSPNILQAEKQAADLRSRASAMASSTSDIDKGRAIQLTGETKGNEYVTKGQAADAARIVQLQMAQLENDAKTKQYNLGVQGKTKAMYADVASKIGLISANQTLSQNTAFTNLVRATDVNRKGMNYNKTVDNYFTLVNDPKFKSEMEGLEKQYTEIYDEAKAKAKYEFDIAKNYPNGDAPDWEGSIAQSTWKTQVETLEKSMKERMAPLLEAQQNMQRQRMLMKKGGSLSKDEKLEIEAYKHRNTKELKQLELEYKAIMHNNEMLQKALIKVFK